MIVFMLIIFLSAVISRIIPLAKKENYDFATIVVAICYVIAYIVLLRHFISLNVL